MRLLFIAAGLLGLAAGPALAAPTAQSKACSEQATAKGLKGAEREKFRSECLKAAVAAAPMAAPKPPPPAAAPAAPKPAAAMAPPAPMAAPAPKAAAKAGFAPKSDAAKACSEQATARGLHGKDRETFRDACLKGAPAAVAAAAKPAPVAAPARAAAVDPTPPEPGKAAKAPPASAKPRTANQLASDARIKRCGALWQADKAVGKTAGQTWPKYWSACSARLKAAGQ